MKTIGIRALRAQLTECVRLAAAGAEEYKIACHGKIFARLVSVHDEGGAEEGFMDLRYPLGIG